MKLFSKFLYHATAYTTVITILFFAFAKITGIENPPSVTFGRFMLIFAFGLVLSAAEYVFTLGGLSRITKYAIHYATLAVAFFFIFLSVRSSADSFVFNAATVFASIIIFSVFYFLALGLFLIFKHALVESGSNGRSAPSGKRK